MSQGLIFDLGVSEGNDTEYYLKKGFTVLALEADPVTYKSLQGRFSSEVESGRLTLIHGAADYKFGGLLDFFAHAENANVSSASKRPDVSSEGYTTHSVITVDWKTLKIQLGVPRYMKIDIEGKEGDFLRGMEGETTLPEFISIECYNIEPCKQLRDLGYERFKLVDQNPQGGFKLPRRQFEGLQISEHQFVHSSGPFGLDLMEEGGWLSYDEFLTEWQASVPKMNKTWFDCHVWKPN